MMELGVEEILRPLRVTGFEVRKGRKSEKFVAYLLEYEVGAFSVNVAAITCAYDTLLPHFMRSPNIQTLDPSSISTGVH
jgi:hypothetical protein